jgi:hypothetical protein
MKLETSKGAWGVFVENVVETQAGSNVLIQVILEQTIDDEQFRMRNLEIIANAEDARDPSHAMGIAQRISEWIESTDGDGVLDTTDRTAHT